MDRVDERFASGADLCSPSVIDGEYVKHARSDTVNTWRGLETLLSSGGLPVVKVYGVVTRRMVRRWNGRRDHIPITIEYDVFLLIGNEGSVDKDMLILVYQASSVKGSCTLEIW
jgi:hypothetical protein